MTQTSDGSKIFRMNADAASSRSNNVSGLPADSQRWGQQSSASEPNWTATQPGFTIPSEPIKLQQ